MTAEGLTTWWVGLDRGWKAVLLGLVLTAGAHFWHTTGIATTVGV